MTDYTDWEGWIHKALLDLVCTEHQCENYSLDRLERDQMQKKIDALNEVWQSFCATYAIP